jgi:hypothetical protein
MEQMTRRTPRAPRNLKALKREEAAIMTKYDQLAEARAAIRRTEDTLKCGDNRFGDYGRRCREDIARWQEVINRIEGEAQA